MLAEPVRIQLSWQDPNTGELQQPILQLPIAIGRELEHLPTTLDDQSVSRLVLNNKQVSRFHALISASGQQIILNDRSANGTFIQKQRLHHASLPLTNHDKIGIGPYEISLTILSDRDPHATETHTYTKTQLKNPGGFWGKSWVLILIGTSLVLLMGVCSWIIVTEILKNYRPQVPTAPTSKVQ